MDVRLGICDDVERTVRMFVHGGGSCQFSQLRVGKAFLVLRVLFAAILWFRAYGVQGLCGVILFAFQAEPGKWVANGGGLSAQYTSARRRKLAKKAHMRSLFKADIQHSQDKVYTLIGELRAKHHICTCDLLLWFSHARSVCKPDIEFCKLHKFGAAGVCWRDKAK